MIATPGVLVLISIIGLNMLSWWSEPQLGPPQPASEHCKLRRGDTITYFRTRAYVHHVQVATIKDLPDLVPHTTGHSYLLTINKRIRCFATITTEGETITLPEYKLRSRRAP